VPVRLGEMAVEPAPNGDGVGAPQEIVENQEGVENRDGVEKVGTSPPAIPARPRPSCRPNFGF
jgi:hypothetical protein